MIRYREARRADVPAIVGLLRDDALGAGRETAPMEDYLRAFDIVAADPDAAILVAEDAAGRIVATCQLDLLRGLSRRAALRGQIEGVRVASDLRGQGIGAALLAEAEARARAAGCTLLQLTSDATREGAAAFYVAAGFAPTHTGFKKPLDRADLAKATPRA